MIDLNELRAKIENILNNKDNETAGITNPLSNYHFNVQTYGYHLDNIANKCLNKNVIPVYIANQSGDIVPIPDLKQENLSYDIYIYFPLALKDDFFKINDFLRDCFVGKMLDYGKMSGKGISNINVPNIGSLDNQQMIEFSNWTNTNYNLPILKTEKWCALNFMLYITQISNSLIFGNQIDCSLKFSLNGITYMDTLTRVSAANSMSADITSQQLMSAKETKGIVKNSSYADSIECYAKNNPFWLKLIELCETSELQNILFTYIKTYHIGDNTLTYTKECYLSISVSSAEYGIPLSYTLTFIKGVKPNV